MRITQLATGIFIFCFLGSFAWQSYVAADDTDLPRFQQILQDVKAFTARVQKAEDDQQRMDALVDLSNLYLHVVSDPRFVRSEKLQGYRGRIAGRLRSEQKQIARRLKKHDKTNRDDVSYGDVTSASDDEGFLIRSAMDHHWQLLSHFAGGTGPSMYYSSGKFGTSGHFGAGKGGGLIGDHGRELVNLIETILHPDFWQVNGGAGTVYYYQPLRILVVRATTTVHEDLTDFLERLR